MGGRCYRRGGGGGQYSVCGFQLSVDLTAEERPIRRAGHHPPWPIVSTNSSKFALSRTGSLAKVRRVSRYPSSTMEIFILRDGQQTGPFNEDTVQTLFQRGSLTTV